MITDALAEKIHKLTALYARLGSQEEPAAKAEEEAITANIACNKIGEEK